MLADAFFNGNIPNQVLVNSYNFRQGIGHHFDGPLYSTRVAILSLSGGAIMIDFIPKKSVDSPPNSVH